MVGYDDCSDFRFASSKLSDKSVSNGLVSATAHKSTESAEGFVNGESHVHNELLFFLHRRSQVLPFDDLVKLTADFYTLEKVKIAHDILFKFIEKRLPLHRAVITTK